MRGAEVEVLGLLHLVLGLLRKIYALKRASRFVGHEVAGVSSHVRTSNFMSAEWRQECGKHAAGRVKTANKSG